MPLLITKPLVLILVKKDTSKYVLSDFKGLTKEQFACSMRIRLIPFFAIVHARYKAQEIKNKVATGQLQPTAIYDFIYVNDGFQGTPIGCEVYKSENGGQTWKKVNTKDLSLYSTYGYYWKIFVSPSNDKKAGYYWI